MDSIQEFSPATIKTPFRTMNATRATIRRQVLGDWLVTFDKYVITESCHIIDNIVLTPAVDANSHIALAQTCPLLLTPALLMSTHTKLDSDRRRKLFVASTELWDAIFALSGERLEY